MGDDDHAGPRRGGRTDEVVTVDVRAGDRHEDPAPLDRSRVLDRPPDLDVGEVGRGDRPPVPPGAAKEPRRRETIEEAADGQLPGGLGRLDELGDRPRHVAAAAGRHDARPTILAARAAIRPAAYRPGRATFSWAPLSASHSAPNARLCW